KGSKVKLSYGFTTGAGDEASLGPAYWIEGWEYITLSSSKGGKSHFVLYASDGWGLLDRWKAGRQFTWDNWASPTGHNDPVSAWTDEAKSYDRNAATYAFSSIPAAQQGDFLELTISGLTCTKVRFYATSQDDACTSIDLDVYKGGAWVDVHDGTYTAGTWVQHSFTSGTVTKARVRFTNSDPAAPKDARLHELQFYKEADAKNIYNLLSFIFARAGLQLSSYSSSTASTTQKPAFTIHPGQSGLTAIRRLLAMVPDVILFSTDTGYTKNTQSSDASDYSYGTDHAIFEGTYREHPQPINRAQVFGIDPVDAPLFTQDFDWDEIALVYDRLAQAIDINLDTTTKAHQR
ncbi:MAG: hypothetical protein KAX80_15765, partial [Planctomycetes bacterium]|nr:hypothetical protein [Planctomycetota bacterium]